MAVYWMLLQTGLFANVWITLARYVACYGGIKLARKWTALNNRLYSFASSLLLLLVLLPQTQEVAKALYHASKFYEYLDIVLVVACGGGIDLHFGFHHLTTPYLTYFRVVQHSQGWTVFAALNTLHHAIMYAYFGGAARMRTLLPFTGTLQLVAGLLTEAWVIHSKGREGIYPIWPNAFASGLLFAYLVLWTHELRAKF